MAIFSAYLPQITKKYDSISLALATVAVLGQPPSLRFLLNSATSENPLAGSSGMRTRIKICGITSVKAVQTAVNTGVDALGFNMYEPSSRFLTPERTAELLNGVPPFITTVGLFVDHSRSQIESVIDRCNFDLLQFHGNEQNDFCRSFDKPFLKAVRVDKETDIERLPTLFPDSIGLLLDAWVDGQLGGTGISFDWTQVPELEKPVILAGGLCADNVQQAIRIAKPYGVDVSSGVESSPGIKDGHLIEAFFRSVSRADLG